MDYKNQLKKFKKVSSVNELLVTNSRECKDLIALQFTKKNQIVNVTYGELKEHVCGLGEGLYAKGIKDTKVAILGPNSYEWILSFFTVISGFNVAVPLDRELESESLAEIINESGCTAIIYDNSYSDIIEDLRKVCPKLCEYINMKNLEEMTLKTEDDSYIDNNIDSLGLIVYTSGTSGKSKGVMLRRKSVVIDSYAASQNVTLGYKTVLVLPLHHTFCMAASLITSMIQRRTVYINSSLKRLMSDIETAKPQDISLVPLFVETLSKKIWSEIDKKNKTKLVKFMIKVSNALLAVGIDIRKKVFKDIHAVFGGRLDFIISGGALLDTKYIKEFRSFGIDIVNGYGIRECSPIISVNENDKNKVGSVGRILPGVQVKISDEGEILVKGDIVMMGYFNDEAETEKAFIDGWFRTGDLGYIDEEGFLYVTGRIKNLIILANGKNVSAEELELKIQNIDAVCEVVVYEKDNKIVAEIYPDYEWLENNGVQDIEGYIQKEVDSLNRTIAQYKRINEIKFRSEEFVKTTTKKIKRNLISK